jgi:hypothetical protein
VIQNGQRLWLAHWLMQAFAQTSFPLPAQYLLHWQVFVFGLQVKRHMIGIGACC